MSDRDVLEKHFDALRDQEAHRPMLQQAREVNDDPILEIQRLSAELNAECDHINRRIEAYEEEMELAGAPGTTAWLDTPLGIGHGYADIMLGYAKVEKRWCIAIRRPETPDTVFPLAKAPRAIRVAASQFLRSVAWAVVRELERRLAAVRNNQCKV